MAAGDSLEAWISSNRATAEEHERKARFLRESIQRKEAGLLAEREVARVVDPLSCAGWRLLHDRAVPGSRANIDHLLVGPPGVIVIDTKAHKGPLALVSGGLRVGGRSFEDKLAKLATYTRTVRQSCRGRAPIYSAICFTRPMGLDRPRIVGEATILEMHQLISWLQELPGALTPRQVWDLAELLETTHPDHMAPASAVRSVAAPTRVPATAPPRPPLSPPRSPRSSQSLRSRKPGRAPSRRSRARTSAAQRLVALLAVLVALAAAQHFTADVGSAGRHQPIRIVSTR